MPYAAMDRPPCRAGMRRFAFVLLTLAGLLFAAGCASAGAPRTCGVILLVDGMHVMPSESVRRSIERQVGAALAGTGLGLVEDARRAEYLATVELRPRPGDPKMTDLILRDVAPNTLRIPPAAHAGKLTDFASIREVEREQAKAMSGFSRPGID